MRLSVASSGESATTRSTKIPGRWMASGSSEPTGTSSSTSAIVTAPAAAHSGLKFRADAWKMSGDDRTVLRGANVKFVRFSQRGNHAKG